MTQENPPVTNQMSSSGLTNRRTKSEGNSLLDWALKWLTTNNANPWPVVGEILLLPMIAVVMGLWLNIDDPLWIEARFPWAWFGPVVLALRYGPLAGIGGACVLLVAWLGLNVGDYATFPKLPFLGGLILVMLIGEFSSLWVARTRRAETIQVYLDQRLDYLTQQYYLLRLSHDRLEQDLISRPMAMRDALKTLRNISAADLDLKNSSQTLMRLLAQYCQLESASLYPMVDGKLRDELLASLGTVKPLQSNDPLVKQALQTNRLCHVSQIQGEDKNSSDYLIAAPLNSVDGESYGLLVIEDLPFFSLHEETLQTIDLLLGYYTDGLTMHTLAAPIRAIYPNCPTEFAFEIQRLWHIGRASSVGSIIVALEILPRATERDMARQLQRMKRSLDENWLIEMPDRQILATLMPLSDESAAEGYLTRLEGWAQQKSGQSLAEIGIFGHVLLLDKEPPLNVLNQLDIIAHAQSDSRSARHSS